MTDKIVDATEQLPEPDALWRRFEQEFHVKECNALKAQRDAIKDMRRPLIAIHFHLSKSAAQADCEKDTRAEMDASEEIQAALVLLDCADDKLRCAMDML